MIIAPEGAGSISGMPPWMTREFNESYKESYEKRRHGELKGVS